MHRLISTDSGTCCIQCGQAFDIYETDEEGVRAVGSLPRLVRITDEALPMMLGTDWVPCFGTDTIPHHWIATGTGMECARCSISVTALTVPSAITTNCTEE